VLFVCVADTQHRFMAQALRLVASLRRFGGRQAEAAFVVAMVEREDAAFAERLRALGATVQVVPRFSTWHGTSNKLSAIAWAIDEVPSESYDVLVLLDCDTVVLDDPTDWVSGEALRARMAGSDTVSHATFKAVFRHFGRPVPPRAYRTNPGNQPTIWYVNTGVVVFPRAVFQALGPRWVAWNRRLLEVPHLFGEAQWYCEQASLAMAFAEAPVPFVALPLVMNYPLGPATDDTPALREPAAPIIVHYHHAIDGNGQLRAPSHAGSRASIDRYNDWAAAEQRRRDAASPADELAMLRGQSAEQQRVIDQQARRMAECLSSSSWRLTAPLRAIARFAATRRPAAPKTP
jgi:hypothetical protein